jgi:hypothetical protein
MGSGRLRRLMERETNAEALFFIQREDEIHLGFGRAVLQ